MKKMKKFSLKLLDKAVAIHWFFGPDWTSGPLGKRVAKSVGYLIRDFTPGLLRAAEHRCNALMNNPKMKRPVLPKGCVKPPPRELDQPPPPKPKKTVIFIGNLDPDVREPRDMPRRFRPATTGCPVDLKGTKPIQVMQWAETVRDLHEMEDNEFLTIHGLIEYANQMHNSVEWKEVSSPAYSKYLAQMMEQAERRRLHVEIIKALYSTEYDKEAAERAEAARRFEQLMAYRWEGQEALREGGGSVRANGTVPVKVTNSVPSVDVRSTEGKLGGRRYWVFGHPITSVMRWMGSAAWTFDDVRAALEKLGISSVKDSTIEVQLSAGRKTYDGFGPPAPLTSLQEEALEQLIDDVPPMKPKPKPLGKLPKRHVFDAIGQGKDPRKVKVNHNHKKKKSKR